jgi:hypothetical protein
MATPTLYLFITQNLNVYPDDRNYAIISKEIQIKLEELVEGDTTIFFSESGLDNDIIKYKLAVPFSSERYEELMSNYKKDSRIRIEKENIDFWCVINDKKYHIVRYPFDKNIITFNHVGIYN